MKVKAIVGLSSVAILFVAYGLDYWVAASQRTAFQTFNSSAWLWGAGIANLLLAGILLGLAWYVQIRANNSKWLALLHIVLGLLATFSVGLYIALPSSLSVLPFDPVPFLTPTSHLSLAGAFMVALGVASLIAYNSSRPRA